MKTIFIFGIGVIFAAVIPVGMLIPWKKLCKSEKKGSRTNFKFKKFIIALSSAVIGVLSILQSMQIEESVLLPISGKDVFRFAKTDVGVTTEYYIQTDESTEPSFIDYPKGTTVKVLDAPCIVRHRNKFLLGKSSLTENMIHKSGNGDIYIHKELYEATKNSPDSEEVEELVAGWGPSRREYTMENPSSTITFNSIVDNYSEVGDERYFVSASEYTGDASLNVWTDYTYVEEGHEYVVRIYVHNNAASNLNLVARDVRAYIMLPTYCSDKIAVESKITCANSEPESVWDGTTFYSSDGRLFQLRYVEDTLKYYTNAGTFSLEYDDEKGIHAFQKQGVMLGYDKIDGNIPGCIAYSGYISFHVEPVFQD